jgi:hypothetical protein
VTIRVRNGKLSSTDGPFAETREILAGFVLIEARDLNEAIGLAEKIPLERDDIGRNRGGFPNRRCSDSRCWLGGGRHGWESLIRRIFASGWWLRF